VDAIFIFFEKQLIILLKNYKIQADFVSAFFLYKNSDLLLNQNTLSVWNSGNG
jgi:hypothetical protein